MTFDAIIIGAGHNGLTLAAYLQRAGLSTIIVERSDRIGGMATTDEPLLPGFRHNPHANYLLYHDVMPMVRDLQLDRLGLRTVAPEAQHGIAFEDGRPPIVLHRPDLLDRTWTSIARYSAADADTYVELKRRAATLGAVVARGVYAPLGRDWFAECEGAVARTFDSLGLPGLDRSAFELIDELFETPEMRALLYQASVEFGVNGDEPGGAFSLLAFFFWTLANWKLSVGGMVSVSNALLAACKIGGVTVRTSAEVTEVVVDGGRVTGVRTSDGDLVRARRLVACSTALHHALIDLVGAANLAPATRAELEAFRTQAVPTLASAMFCLRTPPAYRCARWDADIDRCFHTMVGFSGPDETLALLRDVNRGMLPAPAAAVRVNTIWDATQAPAGFHTAGADIFLPAYSSLAEDDWDDVRGAYNRAFIDEWEKYAPNMTRTNILASGFFLSPEFERKLLVREGTAQYRTDVEGLYLCGASTHPGGGVHGGCAYNAYQAIAEDLDLPQLPGPTAA